MLLFACSPADVSLKKQNITIITMTSFSNPIVTAILHTKITFIIFINNVIIPKYNFCLSSSPKLSVGSNLLIILLVR